MKIIVDEMPIEPFSCDYFANPNYCTYTKNKCTCMVDNEELNPQNYCRYFIGIAQVMNKATILDSNDRDTNMQIYLF